jgi:hypothetical protein
VTHAPATSRIRRRGVGAGARAAARAALGWALAAAPPAACAPADPAPAAVPAAGAAAADAAAAAVPAADAAAAQGAALRRLFFERERSGRLVVWDDAAEPGPVFEALGRGPGAPAAAAALERAVGAPVSAVTAADLRRLFRDHADGWAALYRAYPRAPGLVEVARARARAGPVRPRWWSGAPAASTAGTRGRSRCGARAPGGGRRASRRCPCRACEPARGGA